MTDLRITERTPAHYWEDYRAAYFPPETLKLSAIQESAMHRAFHAGLHAAVCHMADLLGQVPEPEERALAVEHFAARAMAVVLENSPTAG